MVSTKSGQRPSALYTKRTVFHLFLKIWSGTQVAKEFFFYVVFHLFLLPFEFTTFLSLGRPSLPGNSFRPLFLFVCCLKFRPVNAKLSWHQMQAMLIQVSDRYFSPWRQNTSHLLWHTISLIEVMSFKNIRLIKTRRQQKKIVVQTDGERGIGVIGEDSVAPTNLTRRQKS